MIRSARNPGLAFDMPCVELGHIVDHDANKGKVEIGHASFALGILVEACVNVVIPEQVSYGVDGPGVDFRIAEEGTVLFNLSKQVKISYYFLRLFQSVRQLVKYDPNEEVFLPKLVSKIGPVRGPALHHHGVRDERGLTVDAPDRRRGG